jgi:4-hydroxybenzoate polyprenyltransferase
MRPVRKPQQRSPLPWVPISPALAWIIFVALNLGAIFLVTKLGWLAWLVYLLVLTAVVIPARVWIGHRRKPS